MQLNFASCSHWYRWPHRWSSQARLPEDASHLAFYVIPVVSNQAQRRQRCSANCHVLDFYLFNSSFEKSIDFTYFFHILHCQPKLPLFSPAYSVFCCQSICTEIPFPLLLNSRLFKSSCYGMNCVLPQKDMLSVFLSSFYSFLIKRKSYSLFVIVKKCSHQMNVTKKWAESLSLSFILFNKQHNFYQVISLSFIFVSIRSRILKQHKVSTASELSVVVDKITKYKLNTTSLIPHLA